MNSHDTHGGPHETVSPLSDGMRWQLRELRRGQVPARDLWPDIAARLATAAKPETGDRVTSIRHRDRRSRAARYRALPAALAATLVLALGFIGWQQGLVRDQPAMPSPVAAMLPDAAPSLVQREAAGMTRQYQAALVEVGGVSSNTSPVLQPAFDELDRSARLILDALDRDPDSRLLLQQLRRTYSHRLALAQRLVIS